MSRNACYFYCSFCSRFFYLAYSASSAAFFLSSSIVSSIIYSRSSIIFTSDCMLLSSMSELLSKESMRPIKVRNNTFLMRRLKISKVSFQLEKVSSGKLLTVFRKVHLNSFACSNVFYANLSSFNFGLSS